VQRVAVGRDIDRFEFDRVEIRVLGVGRRDPDRLAIEVAPRDLHAIEIRNETIVVSHVERQIRQVRQDLLGNIERNSDVAGRAATIHRSGNVDVEELLVAGATFETHPSGAVGPGRIIKGWTASPRGIDRDRRDKHALGRILRDQQQPVIGAGGSRPLGKARIAAVERVPDRAVRIAHRDLAPCGDGATMLITAVDVEDGGIHVGIQLCTAKLVKHDPCSLREIVVENPASSGPSIVVSFVPVVPVLQRQRRAVVLVAPPRGLSDDGHLHLPGEPLVAGDQRLGRQHTAVEKKAMHAVGKEHPILGVVLQIPMGLAGRGEVVLQRILIERRAAQIVADRVFVVPGVELEARARGRAVTSGPPVLPGPVPVAAPDVDDEIVDVVGHVQEHRAPRIACPVRMVPLEPLVRLLRRSGAAAQANHLVPGVAVSVLHLIDVNGVPLVLIASVVTGGEGGIGTLDGIVEPPVKAVDVQMDEHPVRRDVACRSLQLAAELVPRVLLGVPRVAPGIAVVGPGAKRDRVELVHGAFAEQGVSQLRGSVGALEQEPERLLLRQSPFPEGPALNAHAAIALEAVTTIGVNPFD